LSDEVASASEDEKKIRSAEQRALKKKKNAQVAKSRQKLSIFALFFLALPILYCIKLFFRSNTMGTAVPIPPLQ